MVTDDDDINHGGSGGDGGGAGGTPSAAPPTIEEESSSSPASAEDVSFDDGESDHLSSKRDPSCEDATRARGKRHRNGGGRGGGALRRGISAIAREKGGEQGRRKEALLRRGISPGLSRSSLGSRPNVLGSEVPFRRWDSGRNESVVDLHGACENCPSLTKLRSVYQQAVEAFRGARGACSEKDATHGGRLPLHCIGLNPELVFTGRGGAAEASSAQVEEFIFAELIAAHPAAVIEEDDGGKIPFTEAIYDWVRARRAIRKWRSTVDHGKKSPNMRHVVMKVLSQLPQHRRDNEAQYRRVDEDENFRANDDSAEFMSDDFGLSDLPPIVEWSFLMLCSIIERSASLNVASGGNGDVWNALQGNISVEQNGAALRRSSLHRGTHLNMALKLGSLYSDVVVEKVAVIPHLVEELLLIRDKAARSRVFDLILIRRVLLSETSFGNGLWFSHMLQNGREASEASSRRNVAGSVAQSQKWSRPLPRDFAEGAVFYLECISALNPSDTVAARAAVSGHLGHQGRRNTSLMSDISSSYSECFRKRRSALFSRVGALRVISSLVLLEDDLVERVAATRFIQQYLDFVMTLPIASTMLVLELIINVLTVIAFRLGPTEGLLHLISKDEVPFDPRAYTLWCLALHFCLAHYFIHEFNSFAARRFISPVLLWASLSNPWTVVDAVAPSMILCTSIAVNCRLRELSQVDIEEREFTNLRIAVALTTGVMWMKVLGHVRMLNKHLATFVLCLSELLKDIKWFLFLLLIVMAAFAQMLVPLLYGRKLGNSKPETLEGMYFYAYTVMIGDFDSSMWSGGSISVFFIIYTFTVTIVLLNILIAIISNSYENAMRSSQISFYKVRFDYVSDLLSRHFYFQAKEGTGTDSVIQPSLYGVMAAAAAVLARMTFMTAKVNMTHQSVPRNELERDMMWLEIHSSVFFFCVLGVFWFFMQLRKASYKISLNAYLGTVASIHHSSAPPKTKSLQRYIFAIHSFVLRWFSCSDCDDGSYEFEGTKPQKEMLSGLRYELESIKTQISTNSMESIRRHQDALNETKELVDRGVLSVEEHLRASVLESEQRIESMVAASEDRIARLLKDLVEKQSK